MSSRNLGAIQRSEDGINLLGTVEEGLAVLGGSAAGSLSPEAPLCNFSSNSVF